jgi:hypothetical protein
MRLNTNRGPNTFALHGGCITRWFDCSFHCVRRAPNLYRSGRIGHCTERLSLIFWYSRGSIRLGFFNVQRFGYYYLAQKTARNKLTIGNDLLTSCCRPARMHRRRRPARRLSSQSIFLPLVIRNFKLST